MLKGPWVPGAPPCIQHVLSHEILKESYLGSGEWSVTWIGMEGNHLPTQLIRASFPTATHFECRHHLCLFQAGLEQPRGVIILNSPPWVEAEVCHIAFPQCTWGWDEGAYSERQSLSARWTASTSHVCLPPNSNVEALPSNGSNLEMGLLGGRVGWGQEGEAIIIELVSLQEKRDQSLFLSPPRTQECGHLQAWKWSQPHWHPDLALPVSRNGGK